MPRPNNQSVVVRERTSRPMGHHEQLRTVAVDAEAPHRPRQTPAPRRCFPADPPRPPSTPPDPSPPETRGVQRSENNCKIAGTLHHEFCHVG